MIIRLTIILILFALVFSQEKKTNNKTKNKTIFSNDQVTEDYLNVLKKSLDLLKTNYVDSINESDFILSGI